MNKQKKKRVTTKLSLSWYTLFLYLEDIQSFTNCMHDETLNRLVAELIAYVDEVLALPEGDIEQTYVVVEQRIP